MLPFHIETLYQHEPWANWAVLAATVVTSVAVQAGLFPPDIVAQWFTLGGGGPQALFGHLFAHTGLAQLIGDAFFLWVFGNAICGAIGNLPFLALYLALGCISGLGQLALGGGSVVGAGGALAGLLGVNLALFPVNSVSLYYPHWRGLRTREAPLWTLALYWAAWEALGAAFRFCPAEPWRDLTGATGGLALGLAAVGVGLVQLTEYDNGSLLDYWTGRAAQRKARAADEARAELRRLAQAYFEEYATLPPIAVGAVSETRGRLTLRRSVAFARAAAAPATTAAHFGAKHSTAVPPRLPVAHPTAWPADLPDVRYFHFDGATRHGPETRAVFLSSLSFAIDTTRWWYWAEGMREWRRVAQLAERGKQTPVVAATPRQTIVPAVSPTSPRR